MRSCFRYSHLQRPQGARIPLLRSARHSGCICCRSRTDLSGDQAVLCGVCLHGDCCKHIACLAGSTASSAANTAALEKLNQTFVKLTPTLDQLVVTLTPKPEACKRFLSVAPSSASSGSGGQARQIQRRLGCQFVSNSMGRTPDATCQTFLSLNGQPSGRKIMQLSKPASICRCTLPQRSAPSLQCRVSLGWRRSGISQMPTCTSNRAKLTTSSSGKGKVGNCRLKSCFVQMSCKHRPWCVRNSSQVTSHPACWQHSCCVADQVMSILTILALRYCA